jgi:non-heme chloroperoxidase
MIERFTTRSGVRIRYLDNTAVEPVGLPILFSPGFSDTADEYEEMLQFFERRRVLVVEVRGRGGSETPTTGFASSDHARDLAAVLDEQGVRRFHLVTFSRGTTWGLDLALARPSDVASICIGDYWAGEHAIDAAGAEHMLTTRFRGRPIPERIAADAVRRVFAVSRNRDLTDDIGALNLPVLVVTGTEPGCLLDGATLADFRNRIPGVELATIDGSAHDLFRHDRLAFPRLVKSFIERRVAE